jgi:hypothetical protein
LSCHILFPECATEVGLFACYATQYNILIMFLRLGIVTGNRKLELGNKR